PAAAVVARSVRRNALFWRRVASRIGVARPPFRRAGRAATRGLSCEGRFTNDVGRHSARQDRALCSWRNPSARTADGPHPYIETRRATAVFSALGTPARSQDVPVGTQPARERVETSTARFFAREQGNYARFLCMRCCLRTAPLCF